MTARYSVAFAAESLDLIEGEPPARFVYTSLKEKGGVEYERVRDAIKRLIAAYPFSEGNDDPDLDGGPGSRWARRHLYRTDAGGSPPEVTAYTVWIDAPGRRWWLTWAHDPENSRRLLIYSLAPAPGD